MSCTVYLMYNYDLWNDYDKYSYKKGVEAGGRNANSSNNCVVRA